MTKTTATKTAPAKTKAAAATQAKAPPKTTAKAPTTERNGIRPPSRAGVVLSIWETYEATPNLTTADVAKLAEESGWNVGLARSWFRQWRTYHGIATTTAKKAPAKKAASAG